MTAALAVAAVVVGWAAGQAPRFLPGMTVVQAAASESTLLALVIAVACGSVVLIPSLACCSACICAGGSTCPTAPGQSLPSQWARLLLPPTKTPRAAREWHRLRGT